MTVTISDAGIVFADASSQPTALTTGAQTISGQKTFALVPNVTAAQSMVRLNTANGYGSASICIKRYTNTVTNQGSDITYADSATLGASFTINTNGVYAISISTIAASSPVSGISLNTTAPATSVANIPVAERLNNGNSSGGNTASCSWIGYLPSGSVIRPHCDGAATNSAANEQFTITRVA